MYTNCNIPVQMAVLFYSTLLSIPGHLHLSGPCADSRTVFTQTLLGNSISALFQLTITLVQYMLLNSIVLVIIIMHYFYVPEPVLWLQKYLHSQSNENHWWLRNHGLDL